MDQKALPVYCIECSAYLGMHCYGKPSGTIVDDEAVYEFCCNSGCEAKRKIRETETTYGELDLPVEQVKHLS